MHQKQIPKPKFPSDRMVHRPLPEQCLVRPETRQKCKQLGSGRWRYNKNSAECALWMDVDSLIKDCGEAFSRIFNHRPALQGEINFLLREFEDKRGDREQIRLQRALEHGREINEQLIPVIISEFSANLTRLNLSINATAYACEKIVQQETQHDSKEWLERRRDERSVEWSAFVETMCGRCRLVDEECSSEITRVENYYKDLEEKLKLTP